jgi:Carboxylesterase family
MRNLLLAAFALLLTLHLHAQTCDTLRYRQPIFQVQKTADIVFGTAPAMPAVYVNENVTVSQDLKLDLYQPLGDTLARRPLLMFAFGGGFIIGAKEDEDARALCDSFARKGYVTASITYRLGLNVTSESSGERAVFRAVQDWSAAIRYFKEFADSFRIDTNHIFAGGVSAGSISAMHAQYMSNAERPLSTFASGLPFPAPDLGCKDCSGNTYSHSSKVKALVNAWGAIGDTLWMEASENTPMISFHGDLDPIVPYGYGFPFTALVTLPAVYGSSLIHPRLQHIGIQSEFVPFPGEGHNIWGTVVNNNFVGGPTQYWNPILVDVRDFLWQYLKPETGPISGIGYSYPNAIETYAVPFQAGYHWCWTVNGGMIVSSNPQSNSIDIQWQTLGLRTITARAFSHLDAAADTSLMQVVVGPNGATDPWACGNWCGAALHTWANGGQVQVAASDLPSGAYDLKICDLRGRVLGAWQGHTSGNIARSLPVDGLATGIYALQLNLPGLRLTQKLLILAP